MCATSNVKPNGFLLISSLIVLTVMILMVSFYLNAIIQEVKVAQITNQSPQAYYLAEAGVQEAIWKLQNDIAWKTSFDTNPSWSATLTRNNVYGGSGSYAVSIANLALANAIVTATSTIPVRGTTAQRVVETNVFRALNPLPIVNTALYANDDIDSVGGKLNIVGGDIFANDDITLSFFSNWNVTGAAKAVDDVTVSVSSSLTSSGLYDSTRLPAPATILMPVIDFDSADPTSYKSRANQTYTSGQFAQLLTNTPTLTLNGITYVTGNVHIKKGHDLTVNGVLVSDGTITVGNGYSAAPTAARLDINHSGVAPSGLIAKGNITFGGFSSTITIDGLVYAGTRFRLQDGVLQNVNVTITGGIIAQKIEIYSVWTTPIITLNQDYIIQALGTPLFSQVFLINHWEEEY